MDDSIIFNVVTQTDTSQLSEVKLFLCQNELEYDAFIEFFVTLKQNNLLIACGGLADNIIKCVVISEEARGEGLALKLATELINLAYEHQRTHLFIFTKTSNEPLFQQCGFFTITRVPDVVVLMENSACRLRNYCEELAQQCQPGDKIGAIVINANPFTLGHQYLIRQAAAQCDWLHLFLVQENHAAIPYSDRFELVKQGVKGIANLTLHTGSDYLISRATFPSYFIKDQGVVEKSHAEIDLKIFRQYLAPALKITHRFVGSEPRCRVTAYYNQAMHYWLTTSELPYPAIQPIEIERIEQLGEPISASKVRQLWRHNQLSAIKSLVPESTWNYLKHHPATLQCDKAG